MTAIIALAGATFASPFVLKGDAKEAHVEATEEIVAGGYLFEKPESWGRMGAAAAETQAGRQAGTVVAGLCPAGRAAGGCKEQLQVTFVAYDGTHGKLPLVSSFEDQLDATLPKRLPKFHKVGSATRPSADGSRYLRYEFDTGGKREVIAAYRHGDGSGVVLVVVGPPKAMQGHAEKLDTFFGGASEVSSAGADGGH